MKQVLSLTIHLALKGKPTAFSLCDDTGNYRPTVVAELVNAARVAGRCQLLASMPYDGEDAESRHQRLCKNLEQFKTEVRAMQIEGEDIRIDVVPIDVGDLPNESRDFPTAFRIDVRL